MKIKLLFALSFVCSMNVSAQTPTKESLNNKLDKPAAVFEENKGQMKDQHWNPRPDVLFYGSQEGMNYYIKDNGVSFQLSRVDSWRKEESRTGMMDSENRQVPDQVSTYRVDAHWLSYNTDFTSEVGNALDGYNNYYNVPEGIDPALFVKQFESVTLKNVWNGIDIHYYGTDGLLETDYLVAPGADYSQIKMEIKGAELSTSADGRLIMKTPFGEIHEGELKVFQGDQRLEAYWKISEGNVVSFEVPDYNPMLAMRIDPLTRVWGTYYGGNVNGSIGGYDYGYSIASDSLRNIFLAGETSSLSGIASGGHQNIFAGAQTDAFLVKFNSAGIRQWGTYYGGVGYEQGKSTVADEFGNVYLAGSTSSMTSIAYLGYGTWSGGGDGFLVKFNPSGLRIWGAYTGQGYGNSVVIDPFNNVYFAGSTSNGLPFPTGGHQNSLGGGFDAVLIKFDSSGVVLWDTHYGGGGNDYGSEITIDLTGNVYLSGTTSSLNNISSGGWQNTIGGQDDAFLVKFNSAGIRQWGTYYGGVGDEQGKSINADSVGNLYLAGTTNSSNSIASGGYQNTLIGGSDAFLVKFNNVGQRQWGTYYGGTGNDEGNSTRTDYSGNVYLGGTTESPTNMASGGFQDTIGGFSDAFLVKFDSNGFNQFGASYYGGSGNDFGYSIVSDSTGVVYLAGSTASSNNISTGGHQNIFGGGLCDAFVVKFLETFIMTQPQGSVITCSNLPETLSVISYSSGLSYQWQIRPTGSTQFSNISSGGVNNFSGFNTSTLTIGNSTGLDGYSFRCILSNNFVSEISSICNMSVFPAPSILSQPFDTNVCPGSSATFALTATGSGVTYQWQYGVNLSSFTNIVNGGTNLFTGANTSTLSIANTTGLSNYYFRCILGSTLCISNTISSPVQLYFNSIPIITTQPLSVTACPTQTATFSLAALGTGLIYQWQNRIGSTGTWLNCTNGAIYSGSSANTLQVLNLNGLNNYQYRCIVTNSNACFTTSNISTLTVYSNPSTSITADGMSANPVTINFGDATALVLSGSFNNPNPNILWTPSVGLSSNSVTNPIAYPTSPTNYTATFTNSFGCTQSVSQQININPLPNNGAISVTSGNGSNNFNVFDTIKVQVNLSGAVDIYAAFAKLRYFGTLAPYLTYIGYTAGTILGTGSSIISTPPVASGLYGYDFGISKSGPSAGFSGTGTLYTFFFKPNNLLNNLVGGQVCFYVDNLSITNATAGIQVGLVNQGPSCFNFNNQTSVWPGDLDNSKTVTTADLLKIGIFYNSTGPVRQNASLQWFGQPAVLWGTNTSSPNSDAFKVFVDGNGDGIINNADQTSVGFNMGNFHPFLSPLDSLSNGNGFNRITTTGNLTLTPSPAFVNANQLPQQIELDVNLANSNGTLNNLYGISFDITADTNVFDLQNTTVNYAGSIFGNSAQDFLSIEYVSNGIVSVGMTRFNNPAINGDGLLCKLILNTYAASNYPDTNLVFTGTVMAANDSIGMPYAINPYSVQLPYVIPSSLEESGVSSNKMIVYPNPATNTLNLVFSDPLLIYEIRFLDAVGRVVAERKSNELIKSTTLGLSNLPSGIYNLQVSTESGQVNRRIVKSDQ